jgi:hypothetical protein
MAKFSKCDFTYATDKICPNCGSEDPVSLWDDMKTKIDYLLLFTFVVFICFIIWPAQVTKVFAAFSILFNELIKGFGG